MPSRRLYALWILTTSGPFIEAFGFRNCISPFLSTCSSPVSRRPVLLQRPTAQHPRAPPSFSSVAVAAVRPSHGDDPSSDGSADLRPYAAGNEKKNPLKREYGTPLRQKSDALTITKDVKVVGDPDVKEEKSFNIETILKELQAIQNTGPRKYVILGTRHGSFMHQQIIELLSYALVLTGNHIFTSGSQGTNAAAIRGALRAERPDLLTVVLPQSLVKQPPESQELLEQVEDVIENPYNDHLSLDEASRICNSELLSRGQSLIAFAYHDSYTVIEATKEAKTLDMVVTVLYLD